MMKYILAGLILLTMTAQAEQLEGVIHYGGAEVPVTVFLPENYVRGQTPPLMLTLAPGPGNADMVRANLGNFWLQEGLRRGYIVVAPEIFGRSLDRDPGRFVDDLFKWLGGSLTYDRRNVVLTGQSNGGIGAFHLATARPHQFKSLLVIPGQYIGDYKNLARLQGKPIWMMVGAKDDSERWLEPVKKTYEELKKYNAKVKLDVLPNQGHVFGLRADALYDWLDKSR